MAERAGVKKMACISRHTLALANILKPSSKVNTRNLKQRNIELYQRDADEGQESPIGISTVYDNDKTLFILFYFFIFIFFAQPNSGSIEISSAYQKYM